MEKYELNDIDKVLESMCFVSNLVSYILEKHK